MKKTKKLTDAEFVAKCKTIGIASGQGVEKPSCQMCGEKLVPVGVVVARVRRGESTNNENEQSLAE